MRINEITHPQFYEPGWQNHLYFSKKTLPYDLPSLDCTFYNEKYDIETFVLPSLLHYQVCEVKKIDFLIIEKVFKDLKQQNLTSIIEDAILLILSDNSKISNDAMQVLLPYIHLNETFKFHPFYQTPYAIGLTPFMFTKNKCWLDFFIAQPNLDLSILSNPLDYYYAFSNSSRAKSWGMGAMTEKKAKQQHHLNALEYSVITTQKHKTAKLLSLQSPEQKENLEQSQFNAIIAEKNMTQKRKLMVEQMNAQNQYLLSHLNDERLKNVLVHQNGKIANLLFHVIKEGNLVFLEKMLSLNYFKKHDVAPYKQTYLNYAYQNNKNISAHYLFHHDFYSETEEELRQLTHRYYDKKTYQALFFKNPQKDKLGYSIKLGTLDVLDYILKNKLYTFTELRQIFHDYSSFLLLGRTQNRDENGHFSFIYSSVYSRRAYFYLMKYLVEHDSEHNYVESFLKEIELSLKEARMVRPYLDNALANILGGLLRQIPQAKDEALPFFLSLQPDNTYFIKLEKKGLESFLMQFEKQEQKDIKKEVEEKVSRRKI